MKQQIQVTVAAWSKELPVFARSNTDVVGSNPSVDIYVYMHSFYEYV
jgi:hypothetical protein